MLNRGTTSEPFIIYGLEIISSQFDKDKLFAMSFDLNSRLDNRQHPFPDFHYFTENKLFEIHTGDFQLYLTPRWLFAWIKVVLVSNYDMPRIVTNIGEVVEPLPYKQMIPKSTLKLSRVCLMYQNADRHNITSPSLVTLINFFKLSETIQLLNAPTKTKSKATRCMLFALLGPLLMTYYYCQNQ